MQTAPQSARPNNTANCPICSAKAKATWTKSEHQLFECDACQHLFCLPNQAEYVERTYDQEYFQGETGGYTNYLENKSALIQQGRKYSRIISRHTTRGRLLDIGAAAGFLLKGFVEDGWQGSGCEPNREMAKYARTQLKLEITNQSFESLEGQGTFDAVTLIQVISHLTDPASCLEKIHSLLNDQGMLLIETWNWKSLTAKAFGRNWHQFNPPSVMHWYTPNRLANLLDTQGFEFVAKGRPVKWISVGNGAALVRHSLRETSIGRIATSPLALVPKSLKLPYFLDDVFWLLVRKRAKSNLA